MGRWVCSEQKALPPLLWCWPGPFTGSPSQPYLTASTPAKPECLKPLQLQEAPGTDLEGPADLFPEHGFL